ncbi:ferrous iron transport protein B [Lachnotalea sp. AF33-28]|jgi:ferrous iron transport protein B|uniref:ferrous iron transport protein B n=1 Tax=Lachnotalea sp. AF33-28 TaxID=2292046 RepID=UPI000E50ADCC|nr:ferrous iron transport protein B [Lachnotalea sp. AF33-28]RHP36213.1 ferrous iron transport protein B [Lachnotalea sp. AF33-28]
MDSVSEFKVEKNSNSDFVIALAGNPNVGKSTVFNNLTGLRQHTGNWPGKTVTCAQGSCIFHDRRYIFVDLPGTYSLLAHSAEEEVARDFICHGDADAVITVCDATSLERNLNLVLQIQDLTDNLILCVNLCDEAEKRGIDINFDKLSELLGIPVVPTAASRKKGLKHLMEVTETLCLKNEPVHLSDAALGVMNMSIEPEEILSEDQAIRYIQKAEDIAGQVVTVHSSNYHKREEKIDRIFTGKFTAVPIMILLLMGIFWLTITGANYPSKLLSDGLFYIQDQLLALAQSLNAPDWLTGSLILGVYRVLAWVVSVMLPPMAIFFPLFTLLEDFGYLPRVAFNLDRHFKKCCACGKQALTMCMGFGCNAAGVIGCRIIDSKRERLIAILTNSLVPCNGRFPTILSLITMFFVGFGIGLKNSLLSAAMLTFVILFGILMTFAVSWMLSKTLLRGEPSSFTLELPPYRKPQIGKVVVRSIFDRTLFVLARAVAVAAPAGLIIWILANNTIGGQSILAHCTQFLDPFGRLIGMDGVIIMAFILGFPANEIVVPIILMCYLSTGTLLELDDLSQLHALLVQNGWTWVTAVCVMLFSLLHWPCSTTCLTIKKEAGGWKWAALAVAIPTALGILACFLVAQISRLF